MVGLLPKFINLQKEIFVPETGKDKIRDWNKNGKIGTNESPIEKKGFHSLQKLQDKLR